MIRSEVVGLGLAGLAGLVGLAALRVALRDVPLLSGDPVRGGPRGAFHVHTDSSHDGRIPASEILDGAAAIGLDFVVFTEHDAQPSHPSAPGGPIAVPGTELSTAYGHLLYVGWDSVPEPTVRRSVGIVDSLAVRGAFTVLAHPVSPRRPWLGRLAGIGGLEIASTSDDARIAGSPFVRLLAPLFALPLNRRLALAQLYRRDTLALRMWDRLADPTVRGLCGTDAHGWLDPTWNLRTWEVVLDPLPPGRESLRPASGSLDATAVVDRLRAGRFVCVAGLLSDGAPEFSFRAVRQDGTEVPQGGRVEEGLAVALEVDAPSAFRPDGEAEPVTTVLFLDGKEIRRTTEPTLRHQDLAPGLWRVEVRLRVPEVFFGGRELTALYSNRILVEEAIP